jgi:NtrC-family two-component system sensor histidine kinase KinB
VLFVNHREPHVYTENDVRLVSALANQAGATIANVRLFSQVSEARDRLEAIINSTQEGILVLDNTGRVVIANAHMEFFSDLRRDQLIGYTVEEIFQRHEAKLLNLLGIEPDDLRSWMDGVGMSAASERRAFVIPSAVVIPGPQSSTRARFTELFDTPVLDEVGQVIGRLMVFRDITEEKELEQMRRDLTSMMVHDLRSPLTAVLSGLEMVKELTVGEQSDPLAIQAMDVAGRGCQDMLAMVNTLLDISRLESGRMPLERGPAPFPPLARSAVSYLSPLAGERNITVDSDFEPGLPMVEIDNEKIRRVLINFLDNAIKFAPDGSSVMLRATHQRTEAEDVVVCSLVDKGPGIPKEFHDKIFDRFAQVRSGSAATRRRGSGLGLAFCKLAIEAHEGKVWVESEPGHGSTFFFTLPVAHVKDWLSD